MDTDIQRHHTFKMKSKLFPGGSALAPVCADLAAEVASQPVDGAADMSQLLLGRQALDVSAVPQHPSSQRHQHKQSPCMDISYHTHAIQPWKYIIFNGRGKLLFKKKRQNKKTKWRTNLPESIIIFGNSVIIMNPFHLHNCVTNIIKALNASSGVVISYQYRPVSLQSPVL